MLNINHLTLERAGHFLFRHLDFTFQQKRYGLVGANGVGKSTLAKLLAGELMPDEGHVHGTERVFYVPQFEERQLMTKVDGSQSSHRRSRLRKSRLLKSQNDRVETLSGGEWMRVRLADAFAKDTDFLILDEPTNNLDQEAKELVRAHIRSCRSGLIVISHDRDVLRELDEIIELTPKGLNRYGDGFDQYWSERIRTRERRLENLEVAKREKRKIEAKRQTERASQTKRTQRGQKHAKSGSLPRIIAGLRKRSAEVTTGKINAQWKDRIESAQQTVRELQDNVTLDPFLRFDFEASALPASKIVFRAEALNVYFETALWSKSLHFQMRGRDRWRLAGGNGSGKSTLLKVLMSEQPHQGELVRSSASLVYLDQEQSLLASNASVLETVSATSRLNPSKLRNELAFFGFTKEKVHQLVRSLSGGERLRAALAKIFLGSLLPQALLLDEPTNNLDFASLEILESALKAYRGLLVIASHDDEFTAAIGIEHTLDLRARF